MIIMQNLFKFQPILKPVLWGGDKIARLKGLPSADERIGESWELSGVAGHETVVAGGEDDGLSMSELIAKYGEKLLGCASVARYGMEMPLLVKVIDACQNLSLQVHPDEEMARRVHNCHGKAEMWYVIDTENDAKIYAGLRRRMVKTDFMKHVEECTVMEDVAVSDSCPGASYYIPAGRIHAIGAGNLLVEIQQSSDVTYRVYDYGRGRELHIDKAMEAIEFETVLSDYRTYYDETVADVRLADCEWFVVDRLRVDGERRLQLTPESFSIFVCVEGSCRINIGGNSSSLKRGDTILVPASAAAFPAAAEAVGQAVLLRSHIPVKSV